MLLIIFSALKFKGREYETDNFSSTLKSSRPLRLGHQSCMDMIYKNNANNNFSPTVKSNRLLGPSYDKSSMDIIYRKNVDNNYSSTLKNAWPKAKSKLQLKYDLVSSMYNLQGTIQFCKDL